MKTSEIINQVCTRVGVAKSELAKRMGVYPSSLYRKIARESMTLEELQECLDALGVMMEMEFYYPDGQTYSSQENNKLVRERLGLVETELEAANRKEAFHQQSLRELRTELNSAVGYLELSDRQGVRVEDYLAKLRAILKSMEGTITCALGETLEEEPTNVDARRLETLRGRHILLVDDNNLNRDILKEVLEYHGLTVDEACNGYEVLAAVQAKEPGYYFCILMDIEMPMMDGFEATMRIRKLNNRIRANTPIIALTANAVAEYRKKGSAVGMDGYLVKPVHSMRLLATLAKLA
ncbi:MAG: response regulator [Clostridiales bacterium]|nr:response regulator [Clostridiales bacterium]